MRLIFKNKGEFKAWISRFATPERHVIYVTVDNEIIVVPTKSTKPIVIAYYKATDKKNLEEVTRTSKAFPIFQIDQMEWDITKAVGVKIKD